MKQGLRNAVCIFLGLLALILLSLAELESTDIVSPSGENTTLADF